MLTINSWKPEEYGRGVASIIKVDKYSTGWETTVGGLWVSNTRIFSGAEYLIFDTLEYGLVIDSTAFSKFGSALVKAVPTCVLHENYYSCDCVLGNYQQFPDISIGIGAQQFVIHAENYLNYLAGGECEVLVYPNSANGVWVAGLPYFREYYNMFDLEKKEIHVVRALRNKTPYNYFNAVVQSGLGIVSVAALAGGAVWVYKRRNGGEYERI
jgi:hypothetical protein